MFDLNFIGAPAFALRVTPEGFVYAGINARLEQLTGLESKNVVGKTPYSVFSKEQADEIVARYARCVESQEAEEYEIFYELPGGGRWWAITITPVIDREAEQVSSILGIAVDVTARRSAELSVQEANARLALAMDVLRGGFWHLDVQNGEFRTSLPLASLVAGPASNPLDFDEYLSFIHEDDQPAADLSPLIAGFNDESVAEYRVKTFERETRWIRCQRRLIRDNNGKPVRIVGVAIDVTDQKTIQERYKQQAQTDVLTGLANRRCLEQRARELIGDARSNRGRTFGLIVLDLDAFKPINDRMGHAAGDEVLKEVGRRIHGSLSDQDIVARIGGDEFAILLDDCDEITLSRFAARTADLLQRPMAIAGEEVRVGASVGTALASGETDLEALMERADADMYRAKSARFSRTPGHRLDSNGFQPMSYARTAR